MIWLIFVTQGAVPTQASNLARPAINAPTRATIKIKETKLYAPLVSLSTEDNNKLIEQLKTGIEITVKQNKYR